MSYVSLFVSCNPVLGLREKRKLGLSELGQVRFDADERGLIGVRQKETERL